MVTGCQHGDRLRSRWVKDRASGYTTVRYRYDGLGRRIERQADAQAPAGPDNALDTFEHFFYSGEQVLETRHAAAAAQPEQLQPKHQYAWSARYVDAAVLRDEYDANGSLLADNRKYFLTDANMNVTAVVGKVEDVWQVQERYVYDAYGQATIYDAMWTNALAASQAGVDNHLLYTGREFDRAAGLYYYRRRFYSPGLGQMTSPDPLGFAAGDANLYRYVGSNPLNLTDPSGMEETLPRLGPGYFPATNAANPGRSPHSLPDVLKWLDRIPGAHVAVGGKGEDFMENGCDPSEGHINLAQLVENAISNAALQGFKPDEITVLEIAGHCTAGAPGKLGPRYVQPFDYSETPQANRVKTENAEFVGEYLRKQFPKLQMIIMNQCGTGCDPRKDSWPQLMANGAQCIVLGTGGSSSLSGWFKNRTVEIYGGWQPIGFDEYIDDRVYMFRPLWENESAVTGSGGGS